MKQTNYFLNSNVTSKEYVDEIFSEVRQIYSIDDCEITLSNARADARSSISPLINRFGNSGLIKLIDNFRHLVNQNIPVKTIEEYLKELKDAISESEDGELDVSTLNRILIPVSENVVVANIIVIGKDDYKGKPILVNEMFVNNKYMKTVEYLLEDLVSSYNGLSNDINVIVKHNMYKGVKDLL